MIIITLLANVLHLLYFLLLHGFMLCMFIGLFLLPKKAHHVFIAIFNVGCVVCWYNMTIIL